MKKWSLIVLLLGTTLFAGAQESLSFFDEKGGIRAETVELSQLADTLITTYHRADDVVWARVVYRIIDMRYKQNFQLYFPVKSDDPEYKSLFRLLLDAITDGLPVYRKLPDDIKPSFVNPLAPQEIASILMTGDPLSDDTDWNISTSGDFLLNYDSVSNKLSFNNYSYDGYVRNQVKFLVQEVYFFDKHTSRLYSKILAIAPLHSERVNLVDNNIMQYLWQSVLFWVSYDQFRPYLAQQVVSPNGNDKARVTYDEFFLKKLYFSYLLGDSNMYSRMLLNYAITEKDVVKEQKRIETELLNFEQDLWEN